MIVRTAMLASCLLFTACVSAQSGADSSDPGAGAGAGAGAGGNAGAGAGECPTGRGVRADRDELVNTGGWELTCATGSESADAVRAPGIPFEMRFEGNEVSAKAGCNQLRGEYTVSGKRLTMTLAIVTRMSCSDDKNLADRSFSELMSQSFNIELLQPQPYRMRLTSDSGQVLVFQGKPIQL
jgi:heat shock protein HslJ